MLLILFLFNFLALGLVAERREIWHWHCFLNYVLGTGLILTPLNGFKLGTWLRKKPFTLMLETYAFASQTDNAALKGLPI